MRKKIFYDCFFNQLCSQRGDIETLSKNLNKFIKKDKIEFTKNKGLYIFLSPNFSSLIRLLSEISFDITSLFKRLRFPSKMFQNKFLENFSLIGFSLVNIILQCCFFGPDIKEKNKINFSKIFSFRKTQNQTVKRIWKFSAQKPFILEFFSLSKGILIETLGIFLRKNPSTIWWSLQLIILGEKFFSNQEISYNFGVAHLLSIEQFEDINEQIFLFRSKFLKNTYSKSKKKKNGLYQENLKMKSLSYSNFGVNCQLYSRKNKLNFLSKSKFLVNYNSFFTGIYGSRTPNQLHFTPQFSFFSETKNLKECIGNHTRAISETNLLKGKFFVNFLKIRKTKGVDFFFPEENFNTHTPLDFYNIIFKRDCIKNKKKEKNSKKENLKNFSILKFNFFSIFNLNLNILKFYSKSNSSSVFDSFLKIFIFGSFLMPVNLKIGLLLNFLVNKKKFLFREFFGFQFENILEFFFGKKKQTVFFGHFWNSSSIFFSFDYASIQKKLFSEYIKFFNFDQTKKPKKILCSFFLKFDFILGNPKILEGKMRKKIDSINLKKKSKYYFTLGKTTENEKYFEIIYRKNKKKCWLAKKFLGHIFFKKKKWHLAKKQYIISLSINSKKKSVWFRLGFVSLKIKDFSTSAKSFLRVIDIEPENFQAWNNLASIFGTALQKKREAYFILKIALRNSSIPFFIYRKFFVLSMDPTEIHFKEILDKLHFLIFKNFKGDTDLRNLILKIIFILLEYMGKKILKHADKKVEKKKTLGLFFNKILEKIYNLPLFGKISKNTGGFMFKYFLYKKNFFFETKKKSFIPKIKKFSFLEFPEESDRFFLFSNSKKKQKLYF